MSIDPFLIPSQIALLYMYMLVATRWGYWPQCRYAFLD